MKIPVILAETAAILLLTGSAVGQNSSGSTASEIKPLTPINRQKGEDIIRQFDKNGDGIIDASERAAARQALEKNGLLPRPGSLTNRMTREEIVRRYDTNHDGRIDEQERAAIRAELFQARNRDSTNNTAAINRPEFNRQEFIKQFDKDGDGRLSDAERKAAFEAMRRRYLGTNNPPVMIQNRRTELIKRFDSNGDGVIDEQERKAAVETFRNRNEHAVENEKSDADNTTDSKTKKDSGSEQKH